MSLTATELLWVKNLSAHAGDYAKKRLDVIRTGWKIFPLGAMPSIIASNTYFVIR